MGLAWLNSTPLVSALRGYFLAQTMQVVTPGSASSRAGSIGFPHQVQSLTLATDSVVLMGFDVSIHVPGG